MTNGIVRSFIESSQNPTPLFRGKTQQIVFIIVSIIAALASTTLIIGSIVFNMPLLCLALIFLVSIVLLSFFLLSNLAILPELKPRTKVKPNNVTSLFTPKNTFLTNFSVKINKKTTCDQALIILQQIKTELHQKSVHKGFPKIKTQKGNFIFPPIIPEKHKSTAIISFSELSSAAITQKNVTDRSWKSAQNSNLPKGAVSSGYVEYEKTEDREKYPFVRLLVQAKGYLLSDGYNIHKFIKILKTTYLNIFSICEEEGIRIIQIPSWEHCLTSENKNLDNQSLISIFNQIAFSEALLYFGFSSVQTIYFISE